MAETKKTTTAKSAAKTETKTTAKTTAKTETKATAKTEKKSFVKPNPNLAKTEDKTTTKTEKKSFVKPNPNLGKEEAKPAAKTSAPAKTYHIAQRKEDGKWQVKAAGADKALKLFDTQQQAIDYAKKVAGNQEANIMIHKKDGSFRKLTY